MTATSKNIELIVKQWTTFDLKTIQHELDVTTTEIATRADESDQSRKKLVELSREFKKNTSEDVRKIVAPILKSFQIEIDSLSKRSKAAEKAFLEIYRHLSELSDPVPALEYAQTLQKRSEKVSDLEVENQKLRETLDEYNHEFADVKNQEVTIKQLREKIKDFEDKTESTIQQRIKEKEKEFQRIFAEKERQLQNQQFDLVTKYAEMEMRQTQLQSALDHAHQEMFEYKSKQEDVASARSSEVDILNQDLERANERASNAERLVDKLREQMDQTEKLMSTKINSDEILTNEENERKLREKLQLELAAKEREIAALVVDTQKLQSTLMKVKETSVTQISDLENVLTAKEKFILQLENKLHDQSDYDEIKRELTILKSIEFPLSHQTNEDQTTNVPKKSLEILLLEKNRVLQSEQTQIKVANNDLESNSYRHCSSPCLKQTNPISLVSCSSSQISFQSIDSNSNEEIIKPQNNSPSKIISLLPINDKLQSTTTINSLSAPVDTNSILSFEMSPSKKQKTENSFVDPQLTTVQWTKLQCPSPSISTDIKPSAFIPITNNSLEPLDTSLVANVVRKILAQHNIGQRIFARHVLTLSQGTVSELLSKPKPWSKLTEKGKESYRKMWSWANSDESILTLKSLSPRKGLKDSTTQKFVQKSSRTPSPSPMSTRTNSPSDQSRNFSSFVPSLLMQTTQRLQNQTFPSFNLLSTEQDNYRNWLMLQEIVRHNSLIKQFKPIHIDLNEQENNSNDDNFPLDLSLKTDSNEQNLGKYNFIDTLQLIQTIKDILNRFSISQKYFGEKILGLSQGSVSDILARPKQWENLTQKGREPFIRMKMFIDDPNGVNQLISSSTLSIEHSIDSPQNLSESSTSSTSSLSPLNVIINHNNKLKPNINRQQTTKKSQIPPYDLPKINLPNEIDTEQLSSQVRELLSSNSIGQRVFGEAVLNLSQGTVSEILSKPRPWHALSVKGREPYIRMYCWFRDTNNVEKLLSWKQERDAFRRKINSTHDNSSKQQNSITDEPRFRFEQIVENEIYPTKQNNDDDLPPIVPLNSSWLNGQFDSDNSKSPISFSTSSIKNDNQIKSTSNSSSKKRKSIPQKIITTENEKILSN